MLSVRLFKALTYLLLAGKERADLLCHDSPE